MKIKRIKIKKRKLRDYLGYAYTKKQIIEIDPNQPPRQYLDTLIHEILHILNPKDSESKVSKDASTIRYYVWEEGYRKKE